MPAPALECSRFSVRNLPRIFASSLAAGSTGSPPSAGLKIPMPANPPPKPRCSFGCMNAMFHPRSEPAAGFTGCCWPSPSVSSPARRCGRSPRPRRPGHFTRAPLADWRAMASSADGSRLVAVQSIGHFGTAYGGIYTSIDSGATWSRRRCRRAIGLGLRHRPMACDWWRPPRRLKLATSGLPVPSTSRRMADELDQDRCAARSMVCGRVFSDGIRLVAAPTASEGEMGRFVPGLIYVSADAGLTWVRTAAPSRGWISVASSADGGRIVAAAARQDSTETPGALFVSKGTGPHLGGGISV